jgi:hypothetical protein
MFANLVNPTIFVKAPMKIQLIADDTEVVSNISTGYT